MNSYELTAVVTAIANSLACKMSDDELNILSAIFVQLGDTLATIATTRELCQNIKE